MTAISAPVDDGRRDDVLESFQVKTSTTIYKGQLVAVDSSGYAVAAVTTATRVVGVAYETVANSGSSGAVSIRVWRTGSFLFVASGMAITNVGAKVYVTDANTVQTSSTSTILVGVIVEYLSATSVRVALTPNA